MYESDSSSDDQSFTETGVLLGYASKEPTDDPANQLGGFPSWLDVNQPPSASLARCRVCRDLMMLLLQLNGNLPEHFPGHDRRLYVFSCRRRTCRRKEGSVRGIRACRWVREQGADGQGLDKVDKKDEQQRAVAVEKSETRQVNIGESLFGVAPSSTFGNPTSPFSTPANSNPFSTNSSMSSSNPFATFSLAAKPPQKPAADALSETFASKTRISSTTSTSKTPDTTPAMPKTAHEPWPHQSSFPPPYPSYYLDADYETLDKPSAQTIPSHARVDMDSAEGTSSSSAKEDKEAFESSLDKTFQRFADRLAQNPEQVIRYEFRGIPLLYSKTDSVGRLLAPHQGGNDGGRVTTTSRGGSGMPRCSECGGGRVFEVQLTPHAITELEAEEVGLEGMDWGTVILSVCAADCLPRGTKVGDVGYVEEWVGVQWEEVAPRRSA